MVATYAQKQAVKRYTDKLKAKGFNHHTVFCTDMTFAATVNPVLYEKAIRPRIRCRRVYECWRWALEE